MKKLGWLLLTVVISMNVSAQVSKGSLMVEGGINLGGTPSASFVETTGFSFATTNYYNKDFYGDIHKSTGGNIFRYSISPTVGYALFKNFVVGTDLQYHRDIDRAKEQDHTTHI